MYLLGVPCTELFANFCQIDRLRLHAEEKVATQSRGEATNGLAAKQNRKLRQCRHIVGGPKIEKKRMTQGTLT